MKRKKRYTFLLSIVLLLTAVVGGTVAYLAVKTASVENQFESAYVTCKVIIGEDESTDVFRVVNSGNNDAIKVKNTSNVDAYIRAAIVVNWMDDKGNVLGTAPVEGDGKDYTLYINTETWQKDNTTGFYYYTAKVGASESTANLINDISENTNNRSTGYTLSVEVIAEAIQADGVKINGDGSTTPAYKDAWGIENLGNSGN